MEAKRGVLNCVFVIVLITMACMVTAVEEGSSSASAVASGGRQSEYEDKKRRNWNTFLLYLKKHKPPLTLDHCSDAHVIEFLKYLDQFGTTKVHVSGCPYFGNPKPPAPCTPCPLMQAWGSLYTMIKMLKIAYAESVGPLESNPFYAPAVGIYLRQAREYQEKARGLSYQRKRRKCTRVGEVDGASRGGAVSEPATDIIFM